MNHFFEVSIPDNSTSFYKPHFGILEIILYNSIIHYYCICNMTKMFTAYYKNILINYP